MDQLSRIENRIQRHMKGRELFFAGKFNQAIEVFQNTINDYGPHIGILCDQAMAYYLKGDFINWRFLTGDIERTLENIQDIVCVETLYKTKIYLAKSKEEQGEIAQALDIYQHLLDAAHTHQIESKMQIILLAQIVRLQSQWGIRHKLSQAYTSLTHFNNQHFANTLNIEVEHALFLAEADLFGVEKALQRFHFLKDKFELNNADTRLVMFDLLEIMLRRRLDPPQELLKIISECVDVDSYERSLLAIHRGQDIALLELAKNIPTFGYLKILSLLHTRSPQAIQSELSFLLEALSPESRRLWKEQLEVQLVASQIEIFFDKNEQRLICGNKVLHLKRKKLFAKIVLCVIENTDLSAEQLIQLVWDMERDESTYLRLRVAIHRLNQLVISELGIPNLIALDPEKVSCKSIQLI